MMAPFRVVILGLACLVAALSSSASPAESGWSKRGVFVFGWIVFDFQTRDWNVGSVVHQLTDCSTSEYFCADTKIMPVVLPRSCRALHVGDQWTVKTITTRVVGMVGNGEPSIYEHPVYLASLGRKNVVLDYRFDRGVIGVYFDPGDSVDLVQLASTRELSKVPEAWALYHVLLTRDRFGPCHN